ncbi:MAG: glgD [Clostridia bacterium]|nr:glgD [Clostridia bacterium]
MHDIMGIINLSEDETAMGDIAKYRPIGAVPIAGRYRVIDFILSNMVNIGIQNVSIFTQGKSRSIVEHLGHGKEWDLDRKKDGLFVFNPYVNPMDSTYYKGDMKNFKDQLEYIKCSKQKYVILSRSYMICNVDLSAAFKFHKESTADITILYKKIQGEKNKYINCDALNIGENGKVISIGRNIGKESNLNISMEMYILKKELLIEIIENNILKGDTMYLKEAIHQQVRKLNVNGYIFNGYLGCINSVENYYRVNMELLDVEISKELFYRNGCIYTNIKDEPPTKYTETANAVNSMVASGCVIEGNIERCVISRRVKIGKNAVVKDCVIMQKCIIEDGAVLQNVILDKNIEISSGVVLRGSVKKPLVIMKNQKI